MKFLNIHGYQWILFRTVPQESTNYYNFFVISQTTKMYTKINSHLLSKNKTVGISNLRFHQ